MIRAGDVAGRMFRFSRREGIAIGTVTLMPGGEIGGYRNSNEHTWSVEMGRLGFRNVHGEATTVFDDAKLQRGLLTFQGRFLGSSDDVWHALEEVPTAAPNDLSTPKAAISEDVITGSGKYDLSHLTQSPSQDVIGPIQDDEALFLFALIRVMRLRRVLEIGGLSGYSATNFVRAVGPLGRVYTIDIRQVPKIAENHVPILMDARTINADVIDGVPLDLIFFDCHEYEVQKTMLERLEQQGMLTERTVLALHDTNLHPTKTADFVYEIESGWVHQPVERRLVNEFRSHGWDAIPLDTTAAAHSPELPYRHGLTVMRKFQHLMT